jgi:murein DD-endopeptidase MepM/ murein hydrolase activator NlpD
MRKIAFFRLNQAAIAGVAFAMSGCSADVARFDFGSNTSFNDQTASIPAPTQPIKSKSMLGGSEEAATPEGTYSEGGAYMPSSSGRVPVKMSALSEPVSQSAPVSKGAVAAANALSPVSPATGEQIEVKQGDTLFGLSKRHGVSVAELMSANGLGGPSLKLGQKLVIPGGKRTVAALAPSITPAAPSMATTPAVVATPDVSAAPAVAAEAPSDWTGSYTVKPGDSLYNVARSHKVKADELQRYNGISDVRKVKPGMVLKMPAAAVSAEPATAAVSVTPPPTTVATQGSTVATQSPTVATQGQSVAVTPPTVSSSVAPRAPSAVPAVASGDAPINPPSAPKMINAAKPAQTAMAPAQVMSDAGAPSQSGKMRWPVHGKIISGFGPRTDGTHNDGVNLAVPMGTEIHAAEDGTVAYAGSELKGYGNLVLVRHENGWVTAYAHSEQVLVARGDKVKRGQVIAKAGKTGSVDQPQVHFEVRQGQKPMDPTPFMEKI